MSARLGSGPGVVWEIGDEGDSIVSLYHEIGANSIVQSRCRNRADSKQPTPPPPDTSGRTTFKDRRTHLRSDQLETRELTPGLLLDDRLDLRVRLGERGVQALVLSHGVSASCPSSITRSGACADNVARGRDPASRRTHKVLGDGDGRGHPDCVCVEVRAERGGDGPERGSEGVHEMELWKREGWLG